MSWEASAWAMRQKLRATNKMVLIVLANCHNDLRDNQCNPSTKYIAEHGGMSQASVNRAIAFLAKEGFITIEHNHRADGSLSSSQYILHVTGGTITQIVGAITVIDQEPVIEPGDAPSVPSDSNESSVTTGVRTKRKTTIDMEFRGRMKVKYDHLIEVDDEIESAVAHKGYAKYDGKQRYVELWLKRAIKFQEEGRNSATNSKASLSVSDGPSEGELAFYARARARGKSLPNLPGG